MPNQVHNKPVKAWDWGHNCTWKRFENDPGFSMAVMTFIYMLLMCGVGIYCDI